MNQKVILGSLLPAENETESMVKITLFPRDLVTYWSRCGLTADFGASFYSFCFPNSKSVSNSLSFILNEIVENAVKYSIKEKNPIKICLYELNGDLIFEVKNYISPDQNSIFMDYIRHLQTVPDISEEYIRMVSKNVENDEASNLGLLTILNDFQLTMAFDFIAPDYEERSVNVQVLITQGDLNAEN